jgi:hypothetical protein
MKFRLIIFIALSLIQISHYVVYALVCDNYGVSCFQVEELLNLKDQSFKSAYQKLNYKLTIDVIDENGFPISELPIYIDGDIYYTNNSGKVVKIVSNGLHLIEALESIDLTDIKASFVRWFDDFPKSRRIVNVTSNITLQLIYSVKYKITLYFYNWYANRTIIPSLVQLMFDGQILNISTNNVWLSSGNYSIMKILFKDENIVKPGKYIFEVASPKVLKIICQVADMNITLLDSSGSPITNHDVKLITTRGAELNLSTNALGQLIINNMPFNEYQIIVKLGSQVITKTFLFTGEKQQLFFPVEFKREEDASQTQMFTMQNYGLIIFLLLILISVLVLDITIYLLYKTRRD